MARAAHLLLMYMVVFISPNLALNGGSMSFMPGNRNPDGTIEMHFYYTGSGEFSCSSQADWFCDTSDCSSLQCNEPEVTDGKISNITYWCLTRRQISTNVTSDGAFSLSGTGCCWEENVSGVSEWSLRTVVDTGQRSDTFSMNRSPISAMLPYVRLPQNCIETLHLLTHDPDGDNVRCTTPLQPDVYLSENSCTLSSINSLDLGRHIFEITLEDYPVSNISMMYDNGISSVRNPWANNSDAAPLSQVPLQFMVETPIETCTPGIIRPVFMIPTPLPRDELHAAVGKVLEITLCAHTVRNRIVDFQVTGLVNMSKSLRTPSPDITVATLTWTPQEQDMHRHIPVCFAAETLQSQSEIRCIVVIVAKSSSLSGEAKVTCGENSIGITIRKTSLMGINENLLKLRDPTCSLSSNETHIIGLTALNSCGTTVEDTGDFIVFKNEIKSLENPTRTITRYNKVRIGFSCQYAKEASVSNRFVVQKSDYIFTESNFGTFSYTFEGFSDQNFTNPINSSQYPLEIRLMDEIYMGIQAHSTLPDVQLFVESCRATPEDDLYSPQYYDIIRQGCILDNTVTVYHSDSKVFNFGIQAFKFSGDYNKVYITCAVVLCAEGSSNSRCSQGCVPNLVSRRRKRNQEDETNRYYISRGPFLLLRKSESLAAENKASLHIRTGVGAFAALFIVSLMVLL